MRALALFAAAMLFVYFAVKAFGEEPKKEPPQAPQDMVMMVPRHDAIEGLRIKPDGTIVWAADKDIVAKTLLQALSEQAREIDQLKKTIMLAEERCQKK